MAAEGPASLNIALVIGVVILTALIIFGFAKLFRSVKCPHCGLEFFTGSVNGNIKCPKCNGEIKLASRK